MTLGDVPTLEAIAVVISLGSFSAWALGSASVSPFSSLSGGGSKASPSGVAPLGTVVGEDPPQLLSKVTSSKVAFSASVIFSCCSQFTMVNSHVGLTCIFERKGVVPAFGVNTLWHSQFCTNAPNTSAISFVGVLGLHTVVIRMLLANVWTNLTCRILIFVQNVVRHFQPMIFWVVIIVRVRVTLYTDAMNVFATVCSQK